MSVLVRSIVAEQMIDDPKAETIDSGIILRGLADFGVTGAFETLIEGKAERLFIDEKHRGSEPGSAWNALNSADMLVRPRDRPST